jgi:hypothetical protein
LIKFAEILQINVRSSAGENSLSEFAEKEGDAVLRWLLPESRAARILAALWTLASVSVLIRTLCVLYAPPRGLAEAQAAQGGEAIFMLILSFPADLIISLPLLGPDGGAELGYAWNTWQSLSIIWLFFFVPGYLQWFCLPRAIKNYLLPAIEEAYCASSPAFAWVRRKCGIKDDPDISCIPRN